ncbi:MAG: 4-hydroxy-tetrahydrodipicolinate synthase [Bacteroidetes bacterium GWF2_38_335]|nr:MAG: 4-hydroxy-tetrahydrodipicolinate synthase [Bacteroidetes bacterium GWF2_38_335]OFY79118.1 MAG: 4-hydroxy-tetrahydrodipicolinate synthase [Bacteroidetes bacterium RIFOXYA12_FULL_38_20]HBS88795.1 4-hydroxy-tetrahydrodipicolinate synthase [Bacteroidales bacterium]
MRREFNLKGSIVALVTPFSSNGSIDFMSLDRLIDFHLENGTNGIVICGTTGEASTLSRDEYCSVINHTSKRLRGAMTVVAGSGCNCTSNTIERSKMALNNGAEALLIVSPYYNKPMPAGFFKHYEAIASSVNAPVILYNVPSRTGKNLPVSTVIDLANSFENIVGVKEASGDMSQVMQLINQRPDNFRIYSGEDSLACPIVLMGADGCISVAANIIPAQFSMLMDFSLRGETRKALDIHFRYLRLMDLNFIESNPIPVKAALSMMGLIENSLRLPLYRMENECNLSLIENELIKTQVLKTVEQV